MVNINKKQIQIFTDGACTGNPGPGGYGVILRYQGVEKELSGGFAYTTNNRMEMYAAIAGLEALKESCQVDLYSDSRYLVDAFEKNWLQGWQRRRWHNVKNPDLWQRLIPLCEQHQVRFHWVRGHAGHAENERCDRLAVAAAHGDHLPPDQGYIGGKAGTSVDRFFAPTSVPIKTDLFSASLSPLQPSGKISPEVQASLSLKHGDGRQCQGCAISMEKRIPKRKPLKPGQTYYYGYYFWCPQCQKMYMPEEAKIYIHS